MKNVSITREDIKANSYNLLLTIIYGLIIAAVYGYWAYVGLHKIWISLIIIIAVGLIDYIVAYLWTRSVALKRINSEKEKAE